MASPPPPNSFGRKGQSKKKKKPKKIPRGAKGRSGFLDRLARKFWVWGLSLVFTALILGLGVLAWYAKDLPDISKLHQFEKSPGIRVYASSGRLIASYGQVLGEPLKYNQFPKELIAAVLATEDRRFFDHHGVDPIGLARALLRNALAGGIIEGGSTITQQLAKNVFLTAERTVTRKLQEAMLAIWLESRFAKEEILEIYLNRVYLGAGNYGVDAAARHYFGKSAKQVNLQESALLAGLLKAPSRYAPTRDAEVAKKRTKQVILNMEDAGMIKPAEAALAISHLSKALHLAENGGGSSRYFSDWVVDELPGVIGRVDGDLEVLTTFDPMMQEKAQAALSHVMTAQAGEKKVSQAALLAMEPDGAVRALIGGMDYAKSQYNRAVQAKRQPGSAFKLFVYLAALEQGYGPETMVSDRPITIGDWSPKNYTEDYRGEIPLREAFYRSINTVAALITHQIGPWRVAKMAERLGISSKLLATPSLALGTNEVTLMEMTGAYAHLAAGGQRVTPYAIREIRGDGGKLLYRYRAGNRPAVVSAPAVAAMNGLLTDVVRRGTGQRAARAERPVAGKTGTTQDYRDAWFIGFTPQLVAGVWMGNDNNSSMDKVTGGSMPAEAWANFMKEALKGKPATSIASIAPAPDAPSSGFGEIFTPSALSPEEQELQQALAQEAAASAASSSSSSGNFLPAPLQTPPAVPAEPEKPAKNPFEWYEKRNTPAEEPVKDDTVLDKLFNEIENGPVEYEYPGDKKRR